MNKAVLISIKPEWCEKIASGEKTIEVRKTRPKLQTPFKCYIYCTRGSPYLNRHNGRLYLETKDILGGNGNGLYERLSGRVIGEFVCDRIITVDCDSIAPFDAETKDYIAGETCLSRKMLWNYSHGKVVYGWHISELKIYDKPMRLQRLYGDCGLFSQCETCGDKCPVRCRPPQSWCYVEALT